MKDKYHDIVRRALIKEGWTITHDPYLLPAGKKELKVDLGAEKMIAAQKGMEIIAVEIKSFVATSQVYEFYRAIGQFEYYAFSLEQVDAGRVLFMAVPEGVYDSFFTDEHVAQFLKIKQVLLLVYNIEQEIVAKWIKY